MRKSAEKPGCFFIEVSYGRTDSCDKNLFYRAHWQQASGAFARPALHKKTNPVSEETGFTYVGGVSKRTKEKNRITVKSSPYFAGCALLPVTHQGQIGLFHPGNWNGLPGGVATR